MSLQEAKVGRSKDPENNLKIENLTGRGPTTVTLDRISSLILELLRYQVLNKSFSCLKLSFRKNNRVTIVVNSCVDPKEFEL